MRVLLLPLATLSLLAASPVLAAPPAGEVFGDWAVECEPAPDGGNRCFLSQTQLLKENGARLLKASIGYLGPNGEPTLVLQLPLGVDLRAGIALKVDDGPRLSLAYQHCMQDGCTGVLPLDAATLEAVRGAGRIRVGMLPYAGSRTVTVDLSPGGLARGMDALR